MFLKQNYNHVKLFQAFLRLYTIILYIFLYYYLCMHALLYMCLFVMLFYLFCVLFSISLSDLPFFRLLACGVLAFYYCNKFEVWCLYLPPTYVCGYWPVTNEHTVMFATMPITSNTCYMNYCKYLAT